jgi:diacylglycerol kinase family enzyme
MCGAGFDAYSLKQIEGLDIKRAAGKFAYVIGGIRAFSRYRFPEIEVELPGGRRERCSFALVSNTSRYGAFFSVSPKARPDDGLLDVFLYQEGGPFGMLRLAIKIILSAFRPSGFSSPSPHLKKTARFRVKNIRLSSAGIVYTQLDGDFASPLPVEISVAPSSIDCILPARTIRRLRNHRDRADA